MIEIESGLLSSRRLPNGDLDTEYPCLMTTLKKISYQIMRGKDAKNFAKVFTAINNVVGSLSEQVIEIHKKHGLDERGIPIDPNVKQVSEAVKEALTKDMQEFFNSKQKINCGKIPSSTFDNVSISPEDYLFLEPLLSDIEVVPGGQGPGPRPQLVS